MYKQSRGYSQSADFYFFKGRFVLGLTKYSLLIVLLLLLYIGPSAFENIEDSTTLYAYYVKRQRVSLQISSLKPALTNGPPIIYVKLWNAYINPNNTANTVNESENHQPCTILSPRLGTRLAN